jgi:uncharacterized protein
VSNLQPRSSILLALLRDRGFKYVDDTIHVFAGGSDQHGAKGDDSGDLDICGVYIEPKEIALGIDREEHFVTSTGDSESRNTAYDVDFNMYTLRKWAFLAAKGNPTVLSYLFMPPKGYWGDIYLERNLFLAKSHVKAFVGFGRGQYERLNGVRGKGKHGQRPELESKHGYDTKAAMHMVRMMYECIELMDTGKMTFPNPNVAELIDIRLGKFTLKQVNQMYFDLEEAAYKVSDNSSLPKNVDRYAISKLLSEVYMEYWNG